MRNRIPIINSTQHYALATVPIIRWLLREEPEVLEAVKKFVAGEGPSPVIVAGPPSEADLERRAKRDDNNEPLELPVVALHLSKERHHLTGERGIKITASDKDVLEIAEWHRRKLKTYNQQIENAKKMAAS